MNTLISAFNLDLDHDALFELMTKYSGFIAGGAATHAFCELPLDRFDGDVDIWIPNTPTTEHLFQGVPGEELYEDDIGRAFAAYFTTQGYALADILYAFSEVTRIPVDYQSAADSLLLSESNHLKGVLWGIEDHGYETLGRGRHYFKPFTPLSKPCRITCTYGNSPLGVHLREIWTFKKGDKQVQVIHAYQGRDDILKNFDFSFCAVGYDPATDQFFGPELELTKDRKGYLMSPLYSLADTSYRRDKYEQRGFTVIPTPDSYPADIIEMSDLLRNYTAEY